MIAMIRGTIFLEFYLALCTSPAFTQGYIPFLRPGAAWQEMDASFDPGPNVGTFQCVQYFLNGDTIIGPIAYHVVGSAGLFQYYNTVTGASSDDFAVNQAALFLREDTMERRVYILGPSWPSEILFYDFSPEPGPYPPTYRYGMNPLNVLSVDTVILDDGPHRRLNFYSAENIVEGIGSMSGFLDDDLLPPVQWLDDLVCHRTAEGTTFDFDYLDCPCGTVLITEASPPSIHMGPSPTSGLLHLNGADPLVMFSILSMDGRTIQIGACKADGTAQIDVSGLKSGVYFIQLHGDRSQQAFRFLKE